jgi:hypothetical protein
MEARVIRSDGAERPPRPNTVEGTIIGKENAAPVDARKRRRFMEEEFNGLFMGISKGTRLIKAPDQLIPVATES